MGIYDEAEKALADRLSLTTIDELLRCVQACQKQQRKTKTQ